MIKMNEASERYNIKVEVPISAILETIFSGDNQDVETLSRWALKYGFVDLIEKDGKKYYQLQNDYTKQSFYILLDKEERKQYDYENYLCDENDKLQNNWNDLKKWCKENQYNDNFDSYQVDNYTTYGVILKKMEELESDVSE